MKVALQSIIIIFLSALIELTFVRGENVFQDFALNGICLPLKFYNERLISAFHERA